MKEAKIIRGFSHDTTYYAEGEVHSFPDAQFAELEKNGLIAPAEAQPSKPARQSKAASK